MTTIRGLQPATTTSRTAAPLSDAAIVSFFERAAREHLNFPHRSVPENSREFQTAPAPLRLEVSRNEGVESDVSVVALSVGGQKLYALSGGDANQVWYGVYNPAGKKLGDLLQHFAVTADWNLTDRIVEASWTPARQGSTSSVGAYCRS